MALKSFNPVTPSLRGLTQVDKSHLWKGAPHKSLTVGLRKTGGRNNLGRITIWHRGGGHKRLYRIVDFKRNIVDIEATVERIEYDPNRTCFIALIKYDDGAYSYILATQHMKAGDKVVSADVVDIKDGNTMPLNNMPVGTNVHNVEMKPGKGGQMMRAAGAFAQLVGKDSGYAQLKLRSGELRIVPLEC